MKELVERKNEITFIDEITNDSLVGILFRSDYKCIPLLNDDGKYEGGVKNDFGGWTSDSKKEYILKAIKLTKAKIFLFKSEYELMRWAFN